MRTILFLVSFVLVVAAVGCDEPPPFDRAPMLASLADVVFAPGYAALAAEAAALDVAAAEFCAAPSASTLDALQAAWSDTHGALMHTEAYGFGPYLALPEPPKAALNFWPARTDLAAAVLAGTEPIDPATLTNAQRGLPILEWLTFDPSGGDAAVLAAFTDVSTGARRCSYLEILAGDLATRTAALDAAWSGPGGYADELATAGQGSAIFPSADIAVHVVLERLVFAVEDMRDLKLGAPLGTVTLIPDPTVVESPFAQRSLKDLEDGLDGVEAVYAGDYAGVSGVGFDEWILTRNASLDGAVRGQLAAARDAIASVALPLDDAVTSDPQGATAIYLAIEELHRLFAVDFAGALGVTVTFNDDGD